MANGSEISIVSVHLTSAQILALFSSPVQIIPPQGLKTLIVPVFAILRSNFGGTAYTVAAANLFLTFANLVGQGALAIAQLTTIGQSISIEGSMTTGNGFLSAPANCENQGLLLSAATQNPTLGNGSVDLVVGYQIVQMP